MPFTAVNLIEHVLILQTNASSALTLNFDIHKIINEHTIAIEPISVYSTSE